MTDFSKHTIIYLISLVVALVAIYFITHKAPVSQCTDYTLNQYEAGEAPVKCINLFLEEYENN